MQIDLITDSGNCEYEATFTVSPDISADIEVYQGDFVITDPEKVNKVVKNYDAFLLAYGPMVW